MGKIRSGFFAVLLFVLGCAFTVSAAEVTDESAVIEASPLRIEQVSVNMPELSVTGVGFTADEIETASAFLGQEPLTLDAISSFSETGYGICYYVLFDISGSIPRVYNTAMKEAVLNLQDALRPQDKLILVTFGEDVILAADGTQTREELEQVLQPISNRDQETYLFEAIDRVALMAQQNTDFERKILICISDGEDFATGMTQSEEARKTLLDNGIPLYAFGISDTAKENLNVFGEFARNTGGQIYVFTTADAAGMLSDFAAGLGDDLFATYHAPTNNVTNYTENFILNLADGSSFTREVLNNRWIPDNDAPYLLSAETVGDSQIRLHFSEPLLGSDNTANYQLLCGDEPMAVSSVAYEDGDTATVNLYLASPAVSGTYELRCSNITDDSMEKNPLLGSDGTAAPDTASIIIDLEFPAQPSSGISLVLAVILLILVILLIALLVFRNNRKKKADQTATETTGEPVMLQQGSFNQHIKVADNRRILHVLVSSDGTKPASTDWAIDTSLIVGRSSICDVTVDDPKISGQHFCLEADDDGIYVSDLNSTNGTSVNGIRINGKRKLNPGDTVDAGTTRFTITW